MARLNARGQALSDTDWHVDRLFEGVVPDATTVRAIFLRYVTDANRPPDGASLYPGQNTTGLVPLTDFDGHALWTDASTPAEVEARRQAFSAPYHTALAAEIARVRARHGVAILFDCHSIRSQIPFLFSGRLPDLNIGTAMGTSCAPIVEQVVQDMAQSAKGYTHVLNGRFTGGLTTRHYGEPAQGVHAIQLELAQSTHLTTESAPFVYDLAKATALRAILQPMLRALLEAATKLRSETH